MNIAQDKKANMGNNASRQSNFELIRIISIILIIISHYSSHGGVAMDEMQLGLNRTLLELAMVGQIGVALFMMTSGYFLGGSNKGLRISKILKMWLQVLFYSSLSFIVMIIIGLEHFSFDGVTKAFLPVTFKTYWFVTVYMVIYVLHPYINRCLATFTRRAYLKYLIIMFVLFSAIKTFMRQDLLCGEVGTFILYYSIGNYLRLYKDNFFSKRKNRVVVGILATIAIIMSVIVFDLVGEQFSIRAISKHSNIFLKTNGSVFVLAIAIAIFCAVGYRNKIYSKAINVLASTSFGVYLIHDNYLIRKYIWNDLAKNVDYANTALLVPHMICVISIVYIICGLIEYIRISTIDRLYWRIALKKIDSIQLKIDKKENV